MLGWEMTHAEMVICPLGQVSPALNRVITELSQNCELVNNSFCHFLSSFAAYSAWNKSVLQICNIPGRELIYGSCPILSCRNRQLFLFPFVILFACHMPLLQERVWDYWSIFILVHKMLLTLKANNLRFYSGT